MKKFTKCYSSKDDLENTQLLTNDVKQNLAWDGSIYSVFTQYPQGSNDFQW